MHLICPVSAIALRRSTSDLCPSISAESQISNANDGIFLIRIDYQTRKNEFRANRTIPCNWLRLYADVWL